jgi:diacylglycerol kinase (ATP)
MLTARGIPVRVELPEGVPAAREAARTAVASGSRALVACGGDGTMNTALQEVAGSMTPFAILPCGTGNDNAHEMGMPTALESWVQSLAAAMNEDRVRVVDLGLAATSEAERWFMGVLSTGFDSSVNERANRMSWPPGLAKYLVGVLAELGSFQPIAYRVCIDGVEHVDQGMLVCVGNGSRYGGGMRVCPDAQVDDGVLELTWLGRVPKTTFLRVFPTVFAGTHVRHPAVRTLRGRTFDIEGAGQVAYADGERIGPLPVRIEVVPAAVRLLDLRPA